MLTDHAKQVLRKEADRILAEPTRFNMAEWAVRLFNAVGEMCGTTLCIAGFIATDAGAELRTTQGRFVRFVSTAILRARVPDSSDAYYKDKDIDAVYPAEVAQWILQLTDEQAKRLFYVDRWPSVYAEAYLDVERFPYLRARVAYERIHFFIDTEGTDDAPENR
jgi:hypothetical protein